MCPSHRRILHLSFVDDDRPSTSQHQINMNDEESNGEYDPPTDGNDDELLLIFDVGAEDFGESITQYSARARGGTRSG